MPCCRPPRTASEEEREQARFQRTMKRIEKEFLSGPRPERKELERHSRESTAEYHRRWREERRKIKEIEMEQVAIRLAQWSE